MRDFLLRLEALIGGVLLACLAITILLQVVARYVFDFPLAWSEELSRYSFVWLTMIVAPICIRKGANLGIDVLTAALPRRAALAAHVVSHAVVLVLAMTMLVWGIAILAVVREQTSPALGLPMHLIYAAIPTGAALMSLELLVHLGTSLRQLVRSPGDGR